LENPRENTVKSRIAISCNYSHATARNLRRDSKTEQLLREVALKLQRVEMEKAS